MKMYTHDKLFYGLILLGAAFGVGMLALYIAIMMDCGFGSFLTFGDRVVWAWLFNYC